jgi:hypothetical protein
MDSAAGSICLGDPWVDRHHLIIQIHTLSYTALGLRYSCRAFEDPLALLHSIHRSRNFVWIILAGYHFILPHPLSTLPELELLCLTNSLWIPCEV